MDANTSRSGRMACPALSAQVSVGRKCKTSAPVAGCKLWCRHCGGEHLDRSAQAQELPEETSVDPVSWRLRRCLFVLACFSDFWGSQEPRLTQLLVPQEAVGAACATSGTWSLGHRRAFGCLREDVSRHRTANGPEYLEVHG